jgi:tetratricopeptide (TPR) repeat protein
MRRVLALASPALLAASAAWAILEEDRDAPPPAPTPTTSVCEEGQVWDDVTSTCVDPETGALDDDRLWAAGRELAYAGRHDEALRVLRAMRASDSPRALTAMGYAERKAGRVEAGLALYEAALAADPGFHLARAYRGMHFVETGDLVAAWTELGEIGLRGGAGGWPYQALREAIVSGAGSY